MPVTVTKQLGPRNVRFTFDTADNAGRFADPALSALRDSEIKLTHARKQTTDALAAFSQKGFVGLTVEFLELMRSYFFLPIPKNDAEAFTYKQALARIEECLNVVGGAFPADGLEIGQLEIGECSKGYKGMVPTTITEGASALVTPNTHSFVGKTPVEANILVDFRLLERDYWLVVNTMIHEATHKFAWTWDHAYFGSGGERINADQVWFANCNMRIMMTDKTDDYFRTTPSRNWSRNDALIRLQRAMKVDNDNEKDPKKRLTAEGLEKAFNQAKADLNANAAAAGLSAFKTEKVKGLTATKALNNADSFSCYVVDMPVSSKS